MSPDIPTPKARLAAIVPAALAAQAEPETVVVSNTVLPLTGEPDEIPMVNSNSPEVVRSEGILVSTFSPAGRLFPSAHLNMPVKGRFNIFFHHIANETLSHDSRTLYIGILLKNEGSRRARVKVLEGASYLSQPDAPFCSLASYLDNRHATVYAGPGDRTTDDVLRGKRHNWPAHIKLKGGEQKMLFVAPIPAHYLSPPINGRSGLARLESNQPVSIAIMSMYGPVDDRGERRPKLAEWLEKLQSAPLVAPREPQPTAPNSTPSPVYGRVAGVSKGSHWHAIITNDSESGCFNLVPPSSYAVPLSTVDQGTLGTTQVQSAPMMVRYPDTAYAAHGNYGMEYDIEFPFRNTSQVPLQLTLSLDTALKDSTANRLRYLTSPPDRIFFRGTVALSYEERPGHRKRAFIHLVERKGERCPAPLLNMRIKPNTSAGVLFRLVYPPDSTPPQAITIDCKPDQK